jgi:hypothetical protein
LVVVFAHFSGMFVGVWPSVRLCRRFHVLHPVNKQPPHLGSYYFQHQMKGPSKYIAALSLDRWEHRREDLVLVQIDAHERLTLPTAALMAPGVDWE